MSYTNSDVYKGLQILEKAVQMEERIIPALKPGDQIRGMSKAITTTLIDALVPEDLEIEAHNTMWKEDAANQLTFLKLIPDAKATQIRHEYDRIKAYGTQRGSGFFKEESLPRRTQPQFERVEALIKIMGETSDAFLLAALEKTIRVEGETGAENLARTMVMKSFLWKKNKSIVYSDTSVMREGANGANFKGLIQLIREGTDGTSGTSRYGTHIIDMEGQPLNLTTLRAKAAKIQAVFGLMTTLLMDEFTRTDLETSMDGAARTDFPLGTGALMLGQNVGGFRTGGANVLFHTDNVLSPFGRGQYEGTMEEGAPPSAPAVSGATAVDSTSKFDANTAGNYFWIVTEVRDDRESVGRRWPTTGTQAVAAGEKVTLTITPVNALSDTFRIYRGRQGDADTEAFLAFEVANDGGGSDVAAVDRNWFRPRTSIAIGLSLRSDSLTALNNLALTNGERSAYSLAVEESAKFLGQKDSAQNTVALATLGPKVGVMELANVLATVARPLVYSACAPLVRNPVHQMVFINVGTAAFEG